MVRPIMDSRGTAGDSTGTGPPNNTHDDSPVATGDSDPKRRKIRKGTRSCWECKRRKVKCTFASAVDAICISCQRRGTRCVSQEFPQEALPPSDRGRMIDDRIGHVETLIGQLTQSVGAARSGIDDPHCAGQSLHGPPCSPEVAPYWNDADASEALSRYRSSTDGPATATTASSNLGHDSPFVKAESQTSSPARFVTTSNPKYKEISRALHAALPCRRDLDLMWKAGAHASIYFHQLMMASYTDMNEEELGSSAALLDVPGPDTHPVLLAKYMFLVVTVLQYLDPESREQAEAMSEPPRVMMKRLADVAISLVTTRDDMLDTLEGLECVLLEGIYQANCGNLRQSWFVFRRVMAVSQLMGIHQSVNQPLKTIEPKTKFNTRFLWYRIVYTDRWLCLMLGLPQGSLDRSMTSDSDPTFADDLPLGRLERMHCVIVSRILERNDSDPSSYGLATTHAIDLELQEAAKTMPGSWWLQPNLVSAAAGPKNDKAVFWDMLRLVTQLFHYNLLNQLHLPFMLRFTPLDRQHDYSHTTCVNASREVLSRFIMFRSFNRVAYCCRAVDFFALTAALTLLLAHLDNHRRRHSQQSTSKETDRSSTSGGDLSFLAHQRLGDRAMMEQVLENMNQIGRVSMDPLSTKSADLLRRLLTIEAESANGRVYRTQSVRVSEASPPMAQFEDNPDALLVRIAYFGAIRIASENVASNDAQTTAASRGEAGLAQQPQPSPSGGSVQHQPELGSGVSPMASVPAPFSSTCIPETQPVLQQSDGQPVQSLPAAEPLAGNGTGGYVLQFPCVTDDPLQQYMYPALTATADDWAFQGVDVAFFDSLMRGSALEGFVGGVE